MRVAKGVEMLPIEAEVMGKASLIHPTLIWDETTAVLVDTGFPGQAGRIREAIEATGVPPERLVKIIITHQDIDHVGSLMSLVAEAPRHIAVLAHADEAPYIQGDKAPVKLAQLEARRDSLPDQMKSVYEIFKRFYSANKVQVNELLTNGQELPYCGGITVIHTPGHTPGHICLYHRESKTLIAGDALRADGGVLTRATPSSDLDTEMSRESLQKLAPFDIQSVICYHGGLYQGPANRLIAELAG